MDKYEYKLKLDQIQNLVGHKDYETAAKIADSINWRKVKSVSTLCMVGDIYEKIKQYEISHEIFLMAYDRSPVGRNIIFRLTLVAVKMGSFEEAEEYYEEFLKSAPLDNMKYILKYEIDSGKGAGLGELIAILEEFKEKEYTEEWAFELAYLYHKSGNSNKCVEVCDELILWFGEGKYVEKALELKMLYQPLNKMQEDKYRKYKQKKDGVVEVYPEDELESGEIVKEHMQIPKIESNPGRFNTQNLQKELAKSMQQILNATEKETVNNTMDNIKKMVKEIPYLYIPAEEEQRKGPGHVYAEADGEIDDSLRIDFQELLAEDQDGQISLFMPDSPDQDPQIHGQMSIDEVLSEWEKTRHAAETAIAVAEKKRLETVKVRALQEAEGIMDWLVDLGPTSEIVEEPEILPEGQGEAREVPEGQGETREVPEGREVTETWISPESQEEMTEWEALEERKVMEAWISREEITEWEVRKDLIMEAGQIEMTEDTEQEEIAGGEIREDGQEKKLDGAVDEAMRHSLEAIQKDLEEMKKQITKPIPDIENIPISPKEALLPKKPILQEGSLVQEEKGIISSLSEEQKKIFAHFMPIAGMEQQICQVLEGTVQRRNGSAYRTIGNNITAGNIIIMGSKGNGKTALATSLIKVIQKETGRSKGKVGKVTANVLNQKDIPKLLKAIAGGYLIIEEAAKLSRETVIRLSSLMESDTGGILIILEDSRKGIEKLMSMDINFARKFTEKIRIPVLTSDELVAFGRLYAREHECEIDDMGILALYNSISSIQKLDEPTTLAEVKEIMDQAIQRAAKGGLKKIFGGRRYTEKGYVLLKEKDFD